MGINRQEVFATVVAHLFAQKKRAAGAGGVCMYRTDDGLKCAIGCLIKEDEFSPRMAGSARALVKTWGDEIAALKDVTPDDVAFLMHLQAIHDHEENWKTPETLSNALSSFVSIWDLAYAPLYAHNVLDLIARDTWE